MQRFILHALTAAMPGGPVPAPTHVEIHKVQLLAIQLCGTSVYSDGRHSSLRHDWKNFVEPQAQAQAGRLFDNGWAQRQSQRTLHQTMLSHVAVISKRACCENVTPRHHP